MRRKAFFLAAVFALIVAGCGGGGGGVVFNPPIPFRLDSIDTTVFPPPITSSDFNIASRSSRPVDFFGTDMGITVPVDVTLLMQDAQAVLLPDFEVRFRFDQARFQADPATVEGLIDIADSANVTTAPLLHVEYVPSGGGPVVPIDILSTRSSDGDITKDLVTLIIAPPQFASVTGNVLAGISFDTAGFPAFETRGFLVFPLSAIPANATISSATLEVSILNVAF